MKYTCMSSQVKYCKLLSLLTQIQLNLCLYTSDINDCFIYNPKQKYDVHTVANSFWVRDLA